MTEKFKIELESTKDIWLDSLKNDIDIQKYNDSIKYVWVNEVQNFLEVFWINKNQFTSKVLEIQKDYWLEQDGVIWSETLRVIYIKYREKLKEWDKLWFDIIDRLNAIYYSNNYKNNPRSTSKYGRLYPNGEPNVLRKTYYYWELKTENIPWTYIDSSLEKKIKKTNPNKWLYAKLLKIGGKYSLVAYYDWELVFASYTSPWNGRIKWWIQTTKWNFNLNVWDGLRYRLTAAPTSVKKRWNRMVTDYMPNAVHLEWAWNWGIFVHAGKVNWERRSHWCIRIPYKYSLWFFKLAERAKNEGKSMKIKVQDS